jgi:tetratricopeptide (TPR) repeat protein
VTAAQGYYQQALEMYQSIGDRLGAANALLGLGAALRLQGDRQQAEERLEEALAIGRQIQYRAAQFNALRTLIALAEEAGDHRSAADYRLEYQRLLVEKR